MQEVTELNIDDKKIEIKNFLNPRYVFLPIDGYKLKVKDADYVYKNGIVAINSTGKIVYSSISGKVLGVKEMMMASGKKEQTLVIENDFMENMKVKKSARKYLDRMTEEEVYEMLEDSSLKYGGTFTIDKLKEAIGPIIINGIDVEKDFRKKYVTFKGHVLDILETIDLILKVAKTKTAYIVIDNDDADIISEVTSVIGTYPNIEVKLVNGEYPNSNPLILKKTLGLENATMFDVEEIYDIYEVLKRSTPVSEKIIAVVGNGIKESSILRVKIGSLLSEAFVNNFDFSTESVEVYLNGPKKGTKVNTLKYVIDDTLEGITVLKSTERIEEPCINCGLCSKKCPMGLDPKFVFDHDGKVKKEYYDKCIQCGLCNFVCPSNIDLKKYMRGDDANE